MTHDTHDPKTLLVRGLADLEAEDDRRTSYKINTRFPDTGPVRRELYPKHVEFFAAGATFRERCLMAANRVGKTDAGAFETALHVTGLYPPWWPGRRFTEPVAFWVAGDTGKTVRDIPQAKLLGPPGAFGTGFLPRHLIEQTATKSGVADALDSVTVRHVSGGLSNIQFKSFDQRREAFQGTAQHGVWLDEEPPHAIYTECLMRTVKTGEFGGGTVFLTFTPLSGMTELVQRFLPQTMDGPAAVPTARVLVQAGWDDVPHLSAEDKAELLLSLPHHERDARSRGITSLGSGAIYLVPESDIRVADFEIPTHWPRGFGFDTGWQCTAAVWGARDPQSQVLYLYSVYRRGQAEIAVHAEAIKARGSWIRGFADAAAINPTDGHSFLHLYKRHDLKLTLANKAVEAGIQEVWEALSTGRLKVFTSCVGWFDEYRQYHRDGEGRIVKRNDHLMDATRYLVRGQWQMHNKPPKRRLGLRHEFTPSPPHTADWMA